VPGLSFFLLSYTKKEELHAQPALRN
jgi:hypothetical protein